MTGAQPVQVGPLVTRSLILFAVHHPRHTKAVDQHPEARRPERGFQWHLHLAVFGQCREHAFRLGNAVDIQRHRASGHFIRGAIRRGVRAHDRLIAHRQAGVDDQVMQVRRKVFARGAFTEGHHHLDLALQGLGIEGESGFAVAIEDEVGIDFHVSAPGSLRVHSG